MQIFGLIKSDVWRTLFLVADVVVIVLSVILGYSIYFDFSIPTDFKVQMQFMLLWFVLGSLMIFAFAQMYSRKLPLFNFKEFKYLTAMHCVVLVLVYFLSTWFYRGWWDEALVLIGMAFGVRGALGVFVSYSQKKVKALSLYLIPFVVASLFAVIWNVLFSDHIQNPAQNTPVSKSIFLMYFFLSLVGFCILRAFEVYLWTHRKGRSACENAVLLGSGQLALRFLKINSQERRFEILGIWSEDIPLKGLKINRILVSDLQFLDFLQSIQNLDIKRIILAEKFSPENRKLLKNWAQTHQVRILELSDSGELMTGKMGFELREVSIEQILNRSEYRFDPSENQNYIMGKRVLVTGAGGSIGSELCRQIMNCAPAELIILGKGENSIFNIMNELKADFPSGVIRPIIASVADEKSVRRVFEKYIPQVVFHAAAHKHVYLMENNPEEAFLNNVIGTQNVAGLCGEWNAEKFVLISTDKAVNPSCVMGQTKALAEREVLTLKPKYIHTDYRIVRFGNVLGSRGSVIPIFLEQIRKGGPITVTHPDVKRFFMSIPEAVSLVLTSALLKTEADVFVLEMGEQVQIVHLAEQLIRQAGFEPHTDIQIVYTGLKEGEKLVEELWEENTRILKTENSRIYGLKL